MPSLSDFDVLTFDCYGTLIDWEAGILRGLTPWFQREGGPTGSEVVLEAYARHESAVEAEQPALDYQLVLQTTLRRLAGEWKLPVTDADAEAFGASVADWPAFPDSSRALRDLARYYKLVILSNVDRASFAGSQRRLGIDFDAVFTAQDIGSYKPDLKNFEYMLRELADRGVEPDKILHTAQSLFHDHLPAQKLGLATAWIDRRRGADGWGATPDPDAEVRPDFTFGSLAEMAEARGAA